MECLIANLNGKVRREKWLGREYYVAPASLIVPGVLPGSQGALLYPEDEVRRNPEAWNNVPLVLDHPVENGQHVSARQPKVLEQYGLGTVFEANANGKLTAEAWFDIERTRAVDQRNGTDILNRLERGEQIELSTGLFTTNVPAPVGSHHNGRPYTHVAKDYRPDHLAILPRSKGACSVQDGCGINTNAATMAYPEHCPACGGQVDAETGKCTECGMQTEAEPLHPGLLKQDGDGWGLVGNIAGDASEGHWATLDNGVHVFIRHGDVVKGPAALKDAPAKDAAKGSSLASHEHFSDKNKAAAAGYTHRFVTEKGSPYLMNAQGQTTRLKRAEGAGQGKVHDLSTTTHYIAPHEAKALIEKHNEHVKAGHETFIAQGKSGKIAVVAHDPKTGAITRHIVETAQAHPEVGKVPLELWNKQGGAGETRLSYHIGHTITHMEKLPASAGASSPGTVSQATPLAGPAKSAGISKDVVEGLKSQLKDKISQVKSLPEAKLREAVKKALPHDTEAHKGSYAELVKTATSHLLKVATDKALAHLDPVTKDKVWKHLLSHVHNEWTPMELVDNEFVDELSLAGVASERRTLWQRLGELLGITRNTQPSEGIDSAKACLILKDGEIKGHPLTDQQRKMFGAACGHKDDATHNAACCPECIEATYNRDFPQSKRDKMPAADFAGPDQSYPIETQADVDAAAKLIGKAADPEAVKRKIIAIAKRKGLKIPEAWQTTANVSTLPIMGMTADHEAAMASITESTSHESATARRATERAMKSGRGEDHRLAADAHRVAAEHHRGMGHNRMTEAHGTLGHYHSGRAYLTGNEDTMNNLIINAFATNEERRAAFDRLDNCGSEKSAAAVTASRIANQRRTPDAHREAVRAHQAAGDIHRDAGNTPLAIDHFRAAKDHESLAANTSTERPTMSDTERKALVGQLITANCACEADRPMLEKLSDGALVGMGAKLIGKAPAVNAEEPAPTPTPDDLPVLPTVNVRPRPQTDADWLRSAPSGIQSAVRNAMKIEQQQKLSLVEQIVANGDYADEAERQTDAKELMGLSLDDLQKQLRRAGRRQTTNEQPVLAPLYFGAAGGPTSYLTDNEANDVLDIDSARSQYDPALLRNKAN